MMKRLLPLFCALGLIGVDRVASAEDLVGVTQIGQFTFLIGFDSDNPLIPNYTRLVRGMLSGQSIVGLDARPEDGGVYAIATTPGGSRTSVSRLYEIDLATGEAAIVISPISPDFAKDSGTATRFGFDFNPTIDKARVVSDRDQNLVLDPVTDVVTPATPLFYAPGDANAGDNPNVTHIAYTNNFDGAQTTQLYAIDTTNGILAKLANSAGTLTTVGTLGISVQESGGFDISSAGTPYALLMTNSSPLQVLYQINLATGQATSRGVAALGLLNLQGLTAIEFNTPPTVTAK